MWEYREEAVVPVILRGRLREMRRAARRKMSGSNSRNMICTGMLLCINIYTHLVIYTYTYLSIYLSTSVCIYHSIYPSIHLSVSPSLHLSISPSLRLCIYLYVSIYDLAQVRGRVHLRSRIGACTYTRVCTRCMYI